MRLDQVIAKAAQKLLHAGIETARLDARLLAAHGLGLSETELILQFDRQLDEREMARVLCLIDRRQAREPVAHILGTREFWGMPFKVSADTLVPRPDSETLIEAVLDRVLDRTQALELVDIGTGTGCLLIALLSELPNARGLGVDISPATLAIATENAQTLGVSQRCSFQVGNYAQGLNGECDILISNPPYLAEAEMADLERDVAHYDPRCALVSGATGLEAYEAIFASVGGWTSRPGVMAFEIGYRQAAAVQNLAERSGLAPADKAKSVILQDLAGRDRVFLIENAPN